jgi:hypothetical protein
MIKGPVKGAVKKINGLRKNEVQEHDGIQSLAVLERKCCG